MIPVFDLIHTLPGHHLLLIAVSVGLSVMASNVALLLVSRPEHRHERPHPARIAAGAAMLGAGMWSMHFFGLR